MLSQCALQFAQLAALREAFHRFDAATVRLNGKHQACANRTAVDQHRAGPTHTMLASDVCSRQE